MQITRKFHKPAYYRDLSGKSADYIRSRIASGELRAFNFSEGTRADWWIHEDDWAAFIATKANVQPSQNCKQAPLARRYV